MSRKNYNPTCLIVDDDATSRLIITNMAHSLGFSTHESYDGRHALERCLRKLPDLILLDLYMPEMDGFDFLRRLRQHEGHLRLRGKLQQPVNVIICSADYDQIYACERSNWLADGHLCKPFTAEDLANKLHSIDILSPRPYQRVANM